MTSFIPHKVKFAILYEQNTLCDCFGLVEMMIALSNPILPVRCWNALSRTKISRSCHYKP